MSLLNHVGPLPSVTQSCVGCKFHVWKLKMSGRNPIYDHWCKHPDARRPGLDIYHDRNDGEYIGEKDRTPNWCPVICNPPVVDKEPHITSTDSNATAPLICECGDHIDERDAHAHRDGKHYCKNCLD